MILVTGGRRELKAIRTAETDMETGQAKDHVKKKYSSMPWKELRKALCREYREYRKYQRDHLKG